MNERVSAQGLDANRLALGPLVLDLAAGELLTAGGQLAGLRRQALQVLLMLGARSGQVVTREELMRHVWPGVVVGDGSLTQAIADIRRVLGDQEHQLVRNVARRGYLLAPTTAAGTKSAAAPTDPPAEGGRRWMAALGALALLLLLGLATALAIRAGPSAWQTPASAAQQPLPAQVPALSIAVLPLVAEGGLDDSEWLADALHGDLTTELHRTPGMLVIARDTMVTYKGKAADPRQVAREMGVRHVVRGGLRREGDQIRLNLTLIDGESGVQRWADTFTAERATLPRTLGDFAVQVERALLPEVVRVTAARREALSPDQVGADDLAMRAYALWYRGFKRDNVLQALALCERAVQLDPNSPRGWNGVAYLNLHAALNGWQPDRALAFRRIEEAAAQLERIDRDAYVTFNAKTIILFWKSDVEGMLRHTRAWIEHHPNYPQAHGAHGAALMYNGHFDDAVRALERALRLSPRDAFRAEWQYRLSMAHFAAGRYGLARDWAQTAATTNPGLRWPPVHVAALWQLGSKDAAREALAAYVSRHGAFKPEQMRPRLPGNHPRFAPQRERLAQALEAAGAR
jgi:TolB-like protein/DNA-binding winged helix-turn-helix (wHTH) protein